MTKKKTEGQLNRVKIYQSIHNVLQQFLCYHCIVNDVLSMLKCKSGQKMDFFILYLLIYRYGYLAYDAQSGDSSCLKKLTSSGQPLLHSPELKSLTYEWKTLRYLPYFLSCLFSMLYLLNNQWVFTYLHRLWFDTKWPCISPSYSLMVNAVVKPESTFLKKH